MRLQNLNLVRFGKFTDTDIPLPKAEHDFHLIVGPNEAGKSTVRGAIADLLFGFPSRYPSMAFLHPQSDLRLAATVVEGDENLAFIRTKGNKNTLRTAADDPLPDNSLTPFIGQSDRAFFETMFGLSHAQLVTGGDAILDASKDVSQVLFQSAADTPGFIAPTNPRAKADTRMARKRDSARPRLHFKTAGKKSEICGMNVSTSSMSTDAMAKGRTGRIRYCSFTLDTFAATKRFSAMGGVIKPTERAITMMMPKCTGSMPNLTATGRNIGVVRRMIVAVSTKVPRNKSNTLIRSSRSTLLSVIASIDEEICAGMSSIVISRPKKAEKPMIIMMLAEVIPDSSAIFGMSRKARLL